jgi:hypothetical protein
MILTDNVTTITYDLADEVAAPVWNSNVVVTIGGRVKQQADSQRLRISIGLRLTQAEITTLSNLLKSFNTLYYTPSRPLYDRATADKMEVVPVSELTINDRAWQGGMIYYVNLTLEEVI